MNRKIYSEGDWIAEVEILKDESDSEWFKYTLKVIKTIDPSSIYITPENGTVFNISKVRTYHGIWTLE